LNYLADGGAATILCSHLGRPKGKRDPALSLGAVRDRLSELVGRPVQFAADCVGEEAEAAASRVQSGEFLLLENTRFHPGETANDPAFASQLASLAELFVNDAFGTAHRAHASNVGVAQYLPAVAGFLLEKELSYLGEALDTPERPFIAILGGAKIEDKIGVITRLLEIAEKVLVGGGMANAFLEARGYSLGASTAGREIVEIAGEILRKGGDQILLPRDLEVADAFREEAAHRTVGVEEVPEGWYSLDIGPRTIEDFGAVLREARTVVWNGPMGVYEFTPFARGTFEIARLVAACQGITIVGGGSSADAVEAAGVQDRIDHVSTGGGASLMMLEGKELPGVSVLLDKDAALPGWE
jgi:phosphoglycerate kinase